MDMKAKSNWVGMDTSPVSFSPNSTPNLYSPSSLGTSGEVSMRKSIDNYGYVVVYSNGERRFEHELVWEQTNGPIHEGCEIHHLDEDKANNDISNLTMMTGETHRRLHKKFMFIGGIWLKECLTCHELLLIENLDAHAQRHKKEYMDKFMFQRTIFRKTYNCNQYYIGIELYYNTNTDKLGFYSYYTKSNWIPKKVITKALFSSSPEYSIGVNVTLTVYGETTFYINTQWRKRKTILPENKGQIYREKRLGKSST